MIFCENCGAQLPDGSKFCPACGNIIAAEISAQQPAAEAPQGQPPVYPAQESYQPQQPAPEAPQPQQPVYPAQESYQQPAAEVQQPEYQAQEAYQPQQPVFQPQDPYQQQNAYQQNAYQNPYQQNPYQQSPYQQGGYQQNPYGAAGYQPQPQAPAAPVSGVTVGKIYNNSFAILKQKPIRLWGLSLLASLLMSLACTFGVLPIIYLPIIFCLQVGMAAVYMDGYRGKEVNSDQIFMGFKNFFRFAGGQGWRCLWILIWGLIPVVGIIFAIIKAYSYRFVPYIMLNDSEISATEALRVSMRLTKGYKGKMFLADLLLAVIVGVVLLIFGELARVGTFFMILFVIVYLIVVACVPLILGLFKAAFYDEIEKEKR